MSSNHAKSARHAGSARPAKQPAETDLQRSIAEVERALTALTSAAKQALGDGVCDACLRTEELGDQGRARLTEWGTEVSRYVAEKPVRSLLAAAFAGCFLGALWRRRRP